MVFMVFCGLGVVMGRLELGRLVGIGAGAIGLAEGGQSAGCGAEGVETGHWPRRAEVVVEAAGGDVAGLLRRVAAIAEVVVGGVVGGRAEIRCHVGAVAAEVAVHGLGVPGNRGESEEAEGEERFHVFDLVSPVVRCGRFLPPVWFVHRDRLHPLHRKPQTASYNFLWLTLRVLSELRGTAKVPLVEAPDLSALQSGDGDAWDAAFRWLWPVVFAVAQTRLGQFLPAEVEDVAIESLEEMVEAAKEVKRVEELKSLAASVAHNRAVSRLREHFAQKRGGGQTESLEARQEQDGGGPDVAIEESPVADLWRGELAGLLSELQSEMKPEQRALLNDFFLNSLSYEQLAAKRCIPKGTIGVYIKRGLEELWRVGVRHPNLLKELEAFLR